MACEAIDANVRKTLGKTGVLTCIPLYSSLTMNEQQRIFEASTGWISILFINTL
jgi:HrpA-like RNA helicase